MKQKQRIALSAMILFVPLMNRAFEVHDTVIGFLCGAFIAIGYYVFVYS